MARIETVLTVFVASPGDVADARKRLERVVDELNFTWSREFGLRLELVKWETHAYSDIGSDAQAVINSQLDEFDIFLGIMWKRFGEPTGRAESGTQEEFQRAKQRYQQDARRVRIMFYFKDSPPASLSRVDPKQLADVNAFRKEVAQSGVLYCMFSTIQQFEARVRHDLSRQVQEWGKTWGGIVTERQRTAVPSRSEGDIAEVIDVPAQSSSITGIVFDELSRSERLAQRLEHDPDVMSRSFLEAQVILDSSPEGDELGCLAAEQAATLIAVALANRLEDIASARAYILRVCERILNLRGLQIEWRDEELRSFFQLLTAAKQPHDDDVLVWIRQHTKK